MHVVLSGYYGFDNVGDEAILFSIINALKSIDSSIEITVLSNNPDSTSKTYGVKSVNRWKLKEISDVLKKADGLISGGGSLLQDQTGMKSIPYYTGIMRIAMWHKKPVFIYAQGMGPINKALSKFIVRRTLNKVAKITVRDEESRHLLTEIGVNKEITIVPDPVLGLNGEAFHNDWIQNQQINGPIVTVSVRDWPSEINYKKKIADSLDKLAAAGNTIVFIPMHGEHDEKSSKSAAELMREPSLIAPSTLSIGEKISVIGESNLLIGMRLHSLIFAAITNTPFIALSYDPKIDSFASIVGQPVAGHVEMDNWDADSLANISLQVLKNENETRNHLREKVSPLNQKAIDTANLALNSFK